MERLVGKQAPSFNMATVNGEGTEFGRVRLEDYL